MGYPAPQNQGFTQSGLLGQRPLRPGEGAGLGGYSQDYLNRTGGAMPTVLSDSSGQPTSSPSPMPPAPTSGGSTVGNLPSWFQPSPGNTIFSGGPPVQNPVPLNPAAANPPATQQGQSPNLNAILQSIQGLGSQYSWISDFLRWKQQMGG